MADDAEQAEPGPPADGEAAPAGRPALGEPPPTTTTAAAWRRWTIGVSALLALLVSLLLLLGDGLAGVLNNLGGAPPSAGTWLGIAAAGHAVLAIASAVLFGAGLASPQRRRAAVLTAWAIIPVGFGWFFLCGRLAGG